MKKNYLRKKIIFIFCAFASFCVLIVEAAAVLPAPIQPSISKTATEQLEKELKALQEMYDLIYNPESGIPFLDTLIAETQQKLADEKVAAEKKLADQKSAEQKK